MDFHLTSEQVAFTDAVSKFSAKDLAPGALERAHSPKYPWAIAENLSAQGLLGIAFTEKDGGMGGTLMDAVIAIQEVALHCPKSADIVQAGNFGAIRTFVEYGSAAQKEKYLPELLAGKKILGLGMSEPGAGSAVTELATTAKKIDGGYLINGSKV